VTTASVIERAAGGLVVRVTSRGREVLLIDDAFGKIAVPKGHLEHGESWEEAAIREVFEETGIHARILGPLGRVEYPISRNGASVRKQVRLFLMEALDESDLPVHQAEEVYSAYYVPWDEGKTLHNLRGYQNWSWLFDKADSVWTWHVEDLEMRWRLQPASLSERELAAIWHDVGGPMDSLVQAVRAELTVVAPEWAMNLVTPDAAHRLPLSTPVTSAVIAQAVEHTLLRPDASAVDIEHLCAEALLHNFPLVCLSPQYVEMASRLLKDTPTRVCTVVGFPLGAHAPALLALETAQVIADGATDVDMVIPIGSMKEDDVWTVYRHVRAVVEAAAAHPEVTIKVILETSFLTIDQVVKASFVAFCAGAHMIKTSTGFAASGARLADVAVMRLIAGVDVALDSPHRRAVKASGGVRSRQEAISFIRYGAGRLGTSSGITLIRE